MRKQRLKVFGENADIKIAESKYQTDYFQRIIDEKNISHQTDVNRIRWLSKLKKIAHAKKVN